MKSGRLWDLPERRKHHEDLVEARSQDDRRERLLSEIPILLRDGPNGNHIF